MARILGLDLGSHSVKGVLIESSLRGAQLRAVAEAVRPETDRASSLKAALQELLASPALHGEQVMVALPGPSLATHQLTLPFTDSKRIDAALAFEVESQLPFDLEDAVFDYQVAGQREKASDLLIGVVRKEELAALLAALTELQIDPRVVTHPALAYHTLLAGGAPMEKVPEGEAVAVVDLGHERTCVAIGVPGSGIEQGRTIPGGGKDLTRALAQEFAIPLADAAVWKQEHGALGSQVNGPDAERAAGAFIRGLQPCLRELRATFKAYTARTRRRVSRVYLCGGTSRLRGIDEQLTQDLSVRCELLRAPAEVSSAGSALGAAGPDVWPAAAQGYALALRAQATGSKAPRFNLRRGDFAFKGDFDYVRDKVGLLVSFAATLLILLVASGLVRNSVLARGERRLDAMLCETTQRVLGKCEKDYARALNLLRGKESPAAAIPKLSAVSLLAELTQRIPSDVPVKFEELIVDTDRISVKGETDTSRLVDKIISSLKTYRCFREVKPGKTEKTKNGQKITFTLDIQVECPDHGLPQG